jgi:lipopolysaccharide/colanic/teichoic acid biosynthesis glycosyltransferase
MKTAGSISLNRALTSAQVCELPSLGKECEHSSLADSTASGNANQEAERRAAFAALVHRPIPVWKRGFDLVGSLLLVALLMPLMIAIAVFIRVVSRGPILFRQVRLGEMGNDFVMYKFRTLHPSEKACENHRTFVANLVNSKAAAEKPDLTDRYIPGAKWLRSTSLDELPQLINIIRGEMSLIGPRPEVLPWSKYEPWQLKRFEVRPGVTGLWQVSGKNKLTFNQMVGKDLEYIAQRSLRLDMWIMLQTFRMMLRRDNT